MTVADEVTVAILDEDWNEIEKLDEVCRELA